MFVDIVKIKVKAGDGGDGAVAFHREKYVAAGGPDGGDGGRGGNVIFVADTNLSTLVDFKYKRKFAAERGQNGQGKKCKGRDGKDIVIKVPLGTLIKEATTGQVMADMSDKQPVVLAKGGNGGWGNTHFATATRQVPRFAKPGLPGEEFELVLELKLLADVGLVGFPNVGKSTLISAVSDAKPKIANYHFTTLSPVLGVVKVPGGGSFVMADIPGLIEGASEGVGLGHQFLRHVDRCRLIVHIVDVSGLEGRDPIEDFQAINRELSNFSALLADRPQLVCGNKSELADEAAVERFRQFVEGQGYRYFTISAATRQGMEELVYAIAQELEKLPPISRYEADFVKPERPETDFTKFTIHRADDAAYVVETDWADQVLASVNMDDYESLQYFQRILRQSGVIDRLEEMGIQEGDTVRVGDFEFEFVF
ncbi:Spo0B-associated GTP-binding protein [Anaerotruncus sp. 2789STDY5834896]|uniref:GTPase Obg n=1 Tax=uncultured Anaerotruncus sp. TaxID=905011 RepID=A0A1C6HZZ3_9FIRM|nr:Spo0B-associated GTP-binding protein [uncultured Anaerotruncus sp.]